MRAAWIAGVVAMAAAWGCTGDGNGGADLAFQGAAVEPITFGDPQGCDLVGDPGNPPVPCLPREINTFFLDAGASDAGLTLTRNNIFCLPLRAVVADGLLDPRVTLVQARTFRTESVLDVASGSQNPATLTDSFPAGGVPVEVRAQIGAIVPLTVRTTQFGITEDGALILAYRLGLTAVTPGESFETAEPVRFPGTDTLIPGAREIGFARDLNGFAIDANGDGVLDERDQAFFGEEIPMGGLAGFLYRHPTPQAFAAAGAAFDTITVRQGGKAPIASMVLPLVDAVVPVEFAAQRRFAAGNGPAGLAALRIDGDAALDLAVANADDATASVLLGDGAGGFGPASALGTGQGPVGIAGGDVTGGGATDLVTANFASDDASLIAGVGDGTFADEVRLAAGTGPSAIVAVDLNGDGRADPVVANAETDDLSVFLTAPAGDPVETRVAVGAGPAALALGDFDGDGRADLAVANEGSGDVSVLLANGDGTFRVPARPGVGVAPVAVAAADLDGDGLVDIATANAGSSDLSVLLGNGDGTFAGERRTSLGRIPAAVALADVNGDAFVDVVTAEPQNDEVSVRPNLGGAFFAEPSRFAVGDGPVALVAADLDGDGRMDLAVANGGSADVSVLLNEGAAAAGGALAATGAPRSAPLGQPLLVPGSGSGSGGAGR